MSLKYKLIEGVIVIDASSQMSLSFRGKLSSLFGELSKWNDSFIAEMNSFIRENGF